jgi:hypothetical protein
MIKRIVSALLLDLKREVERKYSASRVFFLLIKVLVESFLVYVGSTFLILYLAFCGAQFPLSGHEMLGVAIVYFVVRFLWLFTRKNTLEK